MNACTIITLMVGGTTRTELEGLALPARRVLPRCRGLRLPLRRLALALAARLGVVGRVGGVVVLGLERGPERRVPRQDGGLVGRLGAVGQAVGERAGVGEAAGRRGSTRDVSDERGAWGF